MALLQRILVPLLKLVPSAALPGLSNRTVWLHHRIEEQRRRRQALTDPVIGLDADTRLIRSILEHREPWECESPEPCSIPGMLSEAERKYYRFITRYYRGVGEVVEVGPWLGCSTFHILKGLLKNEYFADRCLHVFDDFVWRSGWMDKWVVDASLDAPRNLESFRPLFDKNLADYRNRLCVREQRLVDEPGNERIPPIHWNAGHIELCFVDCGRSMDKNLAWYRAFSPAFLNNRTLIIMQDWQMHKSVPAAWWENTKAFTDRFADTLDLVHEVAQSGIATFLYRGAIQS